MGVTSCDGIRDRLHAIKDTSGLSFRQMAALPEFEPIPPGTLCAIYKGREVPRKWRRRLGLVDLLPAPACPKCGAVHVAKVCTAGRAVRRRRFVRVLGHAGWEIDYGY